MSRSNNNKQNYTNKSSNNKKYDGKSSYVGNYLDTSDNVGRNKGKKISRDLKQKGFTNKLPYVNRVVNNTNDYSWYNKNEGQIKDAAKISWFNQLGANLPQYAYKLDGTGNYTVPGIMVFDAVIGPGTSENATSGASLAGLAAYDAVRRELNKPNPDYEAQDLQMYVMAVDDIYCQYINILRAFGICHTYSGDNLYTPRALMQAIYGWDPSIFYEFISNEANYRAYFNRLIYKASSFLYYPQNYTITDRHAWLFGNVFSDHDSVKGQRYAFRKANMWEFDERGSDQGTRLKYVQIVPGTDTSMSAMLDYFDQSIENLRSSTLVRTLVSDMRQAFSDVPSLEMARLDEMYTIDFTYDTNALMQIENMDVNYIWKSIIGGAHSDSLNVTQNVNDNTLIWQPFFTADTDPLFVQISTTDKVINIHTAETSDEVVTEATRMMTPIYPTIKYGTTTDGYTFSIASDIIIGMYAYADPTGESEPIEIRPILRTNTALATIQSWVTTDLALWTSFDWAPKLFVASAGTGNKWFFAPLIEWDHYTTVGAKDNNSVLANLNTAVNLSVWSVPAYGAWTLK